MTDPTPYMRALRASHDRLTSVAISLDSDDLRKRSYATEWSIADVLSHLGSGAEISSLTLTAGLNGGASPSLDVCTPIWDTWNARSPQEQAERSVAVNEVYVTRAESLTPAERAAFHVLMFGRMPMDLAGALGLRLSEHALHTWDIAVMLDPAAKVAPDAVDLLIDRLPLMTGFMGKKAPEPSTDAVTTSDPERAFTLDTGGVTLAPASAGDAPAASLSLPAETFLRLVYGRLGSGDEAGLTASGVTVTELKSVFPGF